MTVNDPDGAGIAGVGRTRNTGPMKQGKRDPVVSGANNQVQLSTLSGILGALQTESPQRAARLKHLSVAVKTGNYGIDPHLLGGDVIRESLSAGLR